MRIFDKPPFNLCTQCGAALIAPIWAEHLSDRHVRNLWSCEACGCRFETSVYFPVPNETRSQVRLSDVALVAQSEEAHMRYKPKSAAALQLALGGLPDRMRVEVEPGIGFSAKTVGELLQASTWPGNLAVATPQQLDAHSTVKVGRPNTATRVTPKP